MRLTRLSIICLFALSVLLPCNSFAQDKSKNLLQIFHKPFKAKMLPAPGNTVEINARLSGTKSTSMDLRAFMVLDGKFMDIPASKAFLNEYDTPVYQFKVHSPLAEVTYQFILTTKDSSRIVSKRYTLRRQCIPNINLPDINEEMSVDEHAQALVTKAEVYERQIQAYNTALDLLEEISETLGM